MSKPEFVSIEISPSVQGGVPVLTGTRIPVEVIACLYLGGESLKKLGTGYGKSRAELIVAFWYLGKYGGRKDKKLWGEWAKEYDGLFWHGESRKVPDPPRHSESKR